ncbi:DotI/IcmL family type IV secretion protein [Xenorhabdus sp. KJ12.1]|uniref:DotI/IcmL family type IV secretion protein n=1 Tax=Xenorhabdus TaxID=626 RepID=UPI000C03F6A9|nr:DotI/IcmL family type IV secretion protein [Xenorhabdus sp. KJ12.1]PHM67998.1 Dot/Icm type IV secretion system inner membrane complex IcmL/DotI [Xenorhabdus sp. KJ12.1]
MDNDNKDKDNQDIVATITEYVIKDVVKTLNKTWLTISLGLTAVLCLSILTNIYFGVKLVNKEREYFATSEGYVFPITSTKEPIYNENDVQEFAAKKLSESLQLNFVHIDSQLSKVKPDFTQVGYDSFYTALQKSGLIQEIKTKRLNLKTLFSPGNLTTMGKLPNGVFAWQFRFPITMQKVSGDGSYRSVDYNAYVQVVRVSTSNKPNGIAVNQVVLTPAT